MADSPSSGGIFLKIGTFLWSLVTDAKWRNTIIFGLIIIGFLYYPIKASIEEKSIRPVADRFVTTLASGDNGINLEVEKAKLQHSEGKFNFWRLLVSLGKISLLFYFSFYLIGFLVYSFFSGQDQTSTANNMMKTILVMLIFQIIGSVYIIAQDHDGDLRTDVHFIVGEKSFLEVVKFVNPVKGLMNLGMSYELYIEPFASIGERLKH